MRTRLVADLLRCAFTNLSAIAFPAADAAARRHRRSRGADPFRANRLAARPWSLRTRTNALGPYREARCRAGLPSSFQGDTSFLGSSLIGQAYDVASGSITCGGRGARAPVSPRPAGAGRRQHLALREPDFARHPPQRQRHSAEWSRRSARPAMLQRLPTFCEQAHRHLLCHYRSDQCTRSVRRRAAKFGMSAPCRTMPKAFRACASRLLGVSPTAPGTPAAAKSSD